MKGNNMENAQHLAYRDRAWTVQPDAETALAALLEEALAENRALADWSSRLLEGAGVRLRDILDHVRLPAGRAQAMAQAGWRPESEVSGGEIWRNSTGWFPDLVVADGPAELWFRAEDVAQFVAANGIRAAIEGEPFGPFRKALVFGGSFAAGAIERNGHVGYDWRPAIPAEQLRAARVHLQAFRARRRQFDSVAEGLDHTEALVKAAVGDLGQHWACDLWLRAERDYWMLRCPAGARQKARQDALGIGWANIDHHTYDSSRAHYRRTIGILEMLGYELREMLYAGDLAGWGSQVLEQPVLRSTIFADVDLAPHELEIDFAHEELPELASHRRAGILSILHGESILECGLNHVAALYDQKALRAQLAREGILMMNPFSNFPFLYQELSVGALAPVDPARVDGLQRAGHLTHAEAEEIRLNGYIATHLENIERNQGYKGFNKPGIDGVLRALDPRAGVRETAFLQDR
jgi:hypothetical protein